MLLIDLLLILISDEILTILSYNGYSILDIDFAEFKSDKDK